MELLLLASIVAALAAAAAYAQLKLRATRLQRWRQAAHELGLECSRAQGRLTISGMLGAVKVNVELARERSARKRGVSREVMRFSLGQGLIPASLSVRRDSPLRLLGSFASWSTAFLQDDGRVGDEAFDALVELPDLDAYARAALSAEARDELTAFLAMGGAVRKGTLDYTVAVRAEHDSSWLVRILRFMSELAQSLAVTRYSLHARLAHNAERDPVARVRLLNFHFLADPKVEAPPDLLEATARALLADPDVTLRVAAARVVPAAGAAVLQKLLSDPRASVAARIEASRILNARADSELPRLLDALVCESPPELATCLLEIVAERGLSELFESVLKCTSSAHDSVRAAAAKTLAVIVAGRAEPALLRLLSDVSEEVQMAAAEALAAVGSVVAVEPLLPLTRGFGRAQLRHAARAAIAQIQDRIGPVEPGWLSLAEPHELLGALTVLPESGSEKEGAIEIALPGESGPEPAKPRG